MDRHKKGHASPLEDPEVNMDNMYGKAEDFFRDQLAEAWSFYAHLETQRFQYIAFFFTVFGTGVGFVINQLIPKDKVVGSTTLFAVSAIVALLFCFSITTLVIIVRLNIVLDFYSSVMQRTRSYFFQNSAYAAATWDYSTVGLHPRKARLFSVQRAVTVLIGFLSVTLAAAQLIVMTLLIKELTWCAYRSLLSILFNAAMVVLLPVLFVLTRRERRYHLEARVKKHAST